MLHRYFVSDFRCCLMCRKFAYVLVCQGVLCLVIGACSSAESTQPDADRDGSSPEVTVSERPDLEAEAGPPTDVVSQLIRQALRADGSVSYRTLVRQLGTPQRVETRPFPNQYVRGQIDTLRTLVYPGIRALVYDVTSEEKTFLVRLSLSSSQYTTPDGLRVGLAERKVVERLGPPTRRNASQGELIYQETDTTPTSLVVKVQDGRVVQIDWEFSFT